MLTCSIGGSNKAIDFSQQSSINCQAVVIRVGSPEPSAK